MNVKLKGKLRYFLSVCATYLEILLSAILAMALLICAVQMIPPLFSLEINGDTEIFHSFLEDIFTLILGVEALKMLCKHSTGAEPAGHHQRGHSVLCAQVPVRAHLRAAPLPP